MLLATRLRWRLVVPLVTILVGSLLAAFTAPVLAGDGEADNLANYSACVGPATEPVSFGDIGGYPEVMQAAIDCLAHYRITVGTSGGGYGPGEQVTRWQMALLLTRAAGPAGIELPPVADQGFTDISALRRSTRDAVNQLADLGIAMGKTTKTFAPYDPVTRSQMAQFLARFLAKAPIGEGGIDIDDVDSDDTQFTDIEDLSQGAFRAVRSLFEMGVASGTSTSEFSPYEPVTRAQMALFITRMLAHTNARPSGITIQTLETTLTAGDTAALAISLRDQFQRPVPDATIDVFRASTKGKAFDTSGRCNRSRVEDDNGDSLCVIDPADETTDADGNLLYELDVYEDFVLWAWSGELDDRFDLDVTEFASVELSAVKPAVAVRVTDDMHPEAERAPYGRRVTFTFQLVDEDEEPAAEEGVEIRVRSEEENDNRLVRRRTRTYETDAFGQVVLDYRVSDPASGDDDDDSYLQLEVLDSSDLEVEDETTVGMLDGANPLVWSDEDEEPNSLVFEESSQYSAATNVGRGGRNTVTATLLDQYGDPVRGERIHFISDDSLGLGGVGTDPRLAQNAHRRTTSRSGQAVVRYYRDSSDPDIEIVEAFMEDEPTIRTVEPFEHYWVEEAPDDQPYTGLEVLIHDEDRDTLVLSIGTLGPFYLVTYDDKDHFNVDGDAETYESFKEGIDVGHAVDIDLDGHARSDVNTFTRYE